MLVEAQFEPVDPYGYVRSPAVADKCMLGNFSRKKALRGKFFAQPPKFEMLKGRNELCVQYCNDVMGDDLLNTNICKLPADCCALFSFAIILHNTPSQLSDESADSSSAFVTESQNDFRRCFNFLAFVHLKANTSHHNTCLHCLRNNEIAKTKSPKKSETLELLSSVPATSSPMDFIPTSLIKSFPGVFSDFMDKSANLSFCEGHLPSCFKLAQMTPLLKKAGLDKDSQTNYRPISNLNNISKIVERLFL